MKKIVGILAAAALIATSVFAADVSAQVRIAGDIFAYDGTTIKTDKDGKKTAAGSFKMLRAATQSQPYWTPYITLSTSTDEAGASVLFTTGGDGTTDIGIERSNVWFKPLDFLTIKAGFQEYNMNQETIDWTTISANHADSFGYGILYAQDAIAVNAFLGTGNNGWLFQDAVAGYGTTEDPAVAQVKDIYVNGSYEADFGKISAMFEFQGKGGEYVDATGYSWALKTPTTPATQTSSAVAAQFEAKAGEAAYVKGFHAQTITFGAGYKNTIDNLTFWADVVGTSKAAISDKEKAFIAGDFAQWSKKDENKDKSDKQKENDYYKQAGLFFNKDNKSEDIFGLTVDGFVQYDMDALTLKGYVKYEIANFNNKYQNKDGEWKDSLTAYNNMSLGLKFRADYKLDNGITLYGYFGSNNLLRKEYKNPDGKIDNWDNYDAVFVSTIKAGATGSVGILSWETYLQFDTGANVIKATERKDNNQYDKVKVTMPVTLTVAF